MANFNPKIVLNFHDRILNDEYHRFKSWEHCYNAFSRMKERELLCLHLSFYLASWGMYRGSSGLLQKDYKIHDGAVKILLNKSFACLRCSKSNEVSKSNIDLILELRNELRFYYESVQFTRGNEEKKVKGTNTLTSKILLGTLGCVPAFDRYYIDGVKITGMNCSNFNRSSLVSLFEFISKNETPIYKIQRTIGKQGTYYPLMKIMDMYFWQIGFNNARKKNG